MAVNLVKSTSDANDFSSIPSIGFIILSFFFSKLLANAALMIGMLIGNIVGFSIERFTLSRAEDDDFCKQVPKKPPDKAVRNRPKMSHWLMLALGIAMVAIQTTNAFILDQSIQHRSKHLSRISNDKMMVAALSNNERQSQSKQSFLDIDNSTTSSNTRSLDDERVSIMKDIATVDSRSLDAHSNLDDLEDDDRIIATRNKNKANVGVATRTADKQENVTSYNILRSDSSADMIDFFFFNNCNQLPEFMTRRQQNINSLSLIHI